MASQVFWLLSYVSLGLALTLGNRPTSIHSSQQQQQQQQKQQSTSSSSSSSSQTQKSRQDYRFSRDPTISDMSNDLSAASAPEDQLDRLRSYGYEEPVDLDDDDELTRDWLERSDKPWRDPSAFVQRRDQLIDRRDGKTTASIENVRRASGSRGNAFLDEFATAVLDTLYPRHRELLVAAKPPLPIRRSLESRRYDVVANEPLIGFTETRNAKKLRISGSGQREKKLSRSPVMVYRTDQPEEPSIAIGEKLFDTEEQRLLVSRQSSGFADESRNSGNAWLNEPIRYTERNDRIKNRGGADYAYADISNSDDGSSVTNNIGNGKSPGKRNQGGNGGGRGRSANSRGWSPGGQQSQTAASNAGASIASQFLLRSARGNRQYDVPQIECPASEDGMERFACPTPDRMGRYRCIDDHVLCDGFIDCPAAEDEDRQDCMFYKTTKAHLDVLADALLRWARGR